MKALKSLFGRSDFKQALMLSCPSCPTPRTSCPIASFPLSLAEEGETVRIMTVRSGKQLKERLMSMGLQIDDTVTVVSKQPGGATVIEKSGSRYALGGGMTLKINVIRC